jgi:hypothetical protein
MPAWQRAQTVEGNPCATYPSRQVNPAHHSTKHYGWTDEPLVAHPVTNLGCAVVYHSHRLASRTFSVPGMLSGRAWEHGMLPPLSSARGSPASTTGCRVALPASCDSTMQLRKSRSTSALGSSPGASSMVMTSQRSSADHTEARSSAVTSAAATDLKCHRLRSRPYAPIAQLFQAASIGVVPAGPGSAMRLLRPPQQHVRLYVQSPGCEHSSKLASTAASPGIDGNLGVAVPAADTNEMQLLDQHLSSSTQHNRPTPSGTHFAPQS